MSGEQTIQDQSVSTSNTLGINLNKTRRKIPGRVDINELMAKVRNEKKKQKKENLLFFGLVSSVIIITGIIASL
jgi:hypothetical protein